MPALFRFVTVTGTIGAIFAGALYIMASQFEPEQRLETKVVPGIKILKQ